jgi:predicted RNA-binding protein YlqC (UPF0109 family)
MERIDRVKRVVELNCGEVIDPDHDVRVDAVGGQENVLFEVHCEPGDVSLIIGRNGKNIEAIRTIVRSSCRGTAVRTAVEVVNSRAKG